MTFQDLKHPSLPADIELVRAYFRHVERESMAALEIRNPHIEPRVPLSVRAGARPAAILMPLVIARAGSAPRLLVTRRQAHIRFSGHICFPGGTSDPVDHSPVDTALRESQEEIGLDPGRVTVLGKLGDYYTQTGYRITPVVGVVERPVRLTPSPDEVAQIHEISLARVLDARSYHLTIRGEDRGHFAFYEGNVRIGGPTASILIGFYEELLSFKGLIDRS
ncbi:MAG: CoA pyrophosphatase [Pseudomonadales bacterium]